MHTIMNKVDIVRIFFTIDLITAPTSKSWVIVYNSEINMFFVTRLHLTKNQCIMLILSVASIKQII